MLFLVSTAVLENLVHEVTCGSIPVQAVVGREVDAHSFQASPQVVKNLKQADALVYVGAGMEPWLKNGMLNTKMRKLELGKVLSLRVSGGETDPHFWHSPALVKVAAQKIAEFSATLPGANAAKIAACERDFESRINDTEKNVRAILAPIPSSRRVIAVTHESLGYFASSFSFGVVSLMGASTESAPTPGAVRSLVKLIGDRGIGAVFVETGTQKKLMEAVAREAKVKLGGELVADTLAAQGIPGDSILSMWTRNAQTIAESLR